MNEQASPAVSVKPTPTRESIRKALLGNRKGKTRIVSLFGVEIELHQPTLGAILSAREDADEISRTTDVFIKYSYVPGTNEKIFDEADREQILNWPFDEDLLEVQRVIMELTGVDLGRAEKEILDDPLGDSS